MTIERRIDASLPALHPDAELAVYRIAQEALTNVARHSCCDEARLELRPLDGGVLLEVSDAGAGFDPAKIPEGAGIRGMRERALLAGGELEIEGAPRGGTTVRLRLPGPHAL